MLVIVGSDDPVSVSAVRSKMSHLDTRCRPLISRSGALKPNDRDQDAQVCCPAHEGQES